MAVLYITVIVPQTQVYAQGIPQDLNLYATAAVLMDAQSGRILYGKNVDLVLPMASTTKIMTAIIVLENTQMDEIVDISAYAASMPEVKLFVKKGEQFLVRDLLYAMMLESHNDVAVALAEHVGKSLLENELRDMSAADYTTVQSKSAVAAFAGLMNEKAKELGAQSTHFITPNGLDAQESVLGADGQIQMVDHSTSATDLARIMSYCILESPKREEFLTITQMPSHYLTSLDGRPFQCTNHNAFLSMMDGVISGKTGFTAKAGYCYVGALRRGERTYVVALLACGWPNHKTYKWSDTRKLMQYGLDYYSTEFFKDVAYPQDQLGEILVEDGCPMVYGEEARVPVEIVDRGHDPLHGGVLLREDEDIRVLCKMEESLQAPIEKGTQAGVIYYMVDDHVYATERIVTTRAVEKLDYVWSFKQLLSSFMM
ncbi:MAG: D-alanyl-D-alanine carboxypeptidase [Clostridium sp.]|jgi:D-alanyl-D-alanine carboxypeptidase (penicillin-binding protein 5/6)|nr:D-alanyl-D-alanine carboxypeptidase [Clostridium sp.]